VDDLGDKERAKIQCGEAHFHALEVQDHAAGDVVARTADDLLLEAAQR